MVFVDTKIKPRLAKISVCFVLFLVCIGATNSFPKYLLSVYYVQTIMIKLEGDVYVAKCFNVGHC